MPRPKFITEKDIERWSNIIDQDSAVSAFTSSPIIREVCYAGCFLYEELKKLDCPTILIVRIQWTAGKLSFNRDTWEVHQEMIDNYKNNRLILEDDELGIIKN